YETTEALLLRVAEQRLAGRRRRHQQVFTEREHACRIGEARHLDAADLDRLTIDRGLHADDPRPADRHTGGVLRYVNARNDDVAAMRDEHALVRDRDAAITGVRHPPIGQLDLEEAIPLDREIERPAGLRDRALQRDALRGGEPRTAADLHCLQRLRIRLADRRRTLHHLVEQVLEVCAAPLDRKSTRLNSSHVKISYAVFCLKKKNKKQSSN